VENTGTYILEWKSKLNLFDKSLYISHKESLDVPMGLNSETDVNFGGDSVEMCIKMNQLKFLLSYERNQETEYGTQTKSTKSRRKTYFSGKTLALNRKIMELCNNMYPKRRR
jgi:hypothetical protein